jgi:hypothetical protein
VLSPMSRLIQHTACVGDQVLRGFERGVTDRGVSVSTRCWKGGPPRAVAKWRAAWASLRAGNVTQTAGNGVASSVIMQQTGMGR